MGRLIAIGDIHGHYTKMRNLLDKLELGRGDRIVFLGDYVDYGPQTAEVIEYLVNMRMYRDVAFIMGNHDAWFLDYLESGLADPLWLTQGGKETLDSYKYHGVPGNHHEFMQLLSRPITMETMGREYIFSHGMLCPTKDIKSRFDTSDAMWGRPNSFSFSWDGGGNRKPFAWEENQFLVFGHTPHITPTYYGPSVCIDTGAKVDHRPITAAILPQTRHGKIEFINSNGE